MILSASIKATNLLVISGTTAYASSIIDSAVIQSATAHAGAVVQNGVVQCTTADRCVASNLSVVDLAPDEEKNEDDG